MSRPKLLLVLAGFITIVGSFLPWFDTAFGSTNGIVVGGLTTFYAGLLAVPGVMWRRRAIVALHALLLAVAGIGVAGWRLLTAFQQLPAFGQAWLPGPGLILVLVSGGVAAYAFLQLSGLLDRTTNPSRDRAIGR
jgi:hypothetical protein